jgi:DNA repair exonuclease SbcCD nuclease subunit
MNVIGNNNTFKKSVVMTNGNSSLHINNDTKILVVGDLHYQEGDLIMPGLFNKKIDKILDEGKYDCCVLLGDVFHKFENVNTHASKMVYNLFSIITDYCPLFVLVGNHDFINGRQFLTENHSLLPYKKWQKVMIIDQPKRIKMPNCRLLFVPYVPKGRFFEALEDVDKWESVDMIFAHQEFQGCQMGGYVSVDGDGWSEKFPPIISGHCHSKHKIKNITYPGTPYDIGYGGSEKRYVAEVVFTEDSYKINYILTNLPRKKVIRLTCKEAREWVPEGIDYYKLKIVSTKEEYTSFRGSSHAKDLVNTGVKIEHVPSDRKRIDEFLEKRKNDSKGCETYKDIFRNLVKKEGLDEISKKIFT